MDEPESLVSGGCGDGLTVAMCRARHRTSQAVWGRAVGMAQIASQTGLSREQLYRSFSENGNPTLKTTLAVMKALGIELSAKVAA